MNMKKTNTLKGVNSMPAGTRIVTYICLAWALIVSLLPIGWLVLSSLKKDPMARPGFQLPESICLDGYISTFKDLHVMRYFGNSLFVRCFRGNQCGDDFYVCICGSANGIQRKSTGKCTFVFHHVYPSHSPYLSGI